MNDIERNAAAAAGAERTTAGGRDGTARRALIYVAMAMAGLTVLVLAWYTLDVFLLAFIGILFAILLRAPADWLSGRTGLPEGWSLALVCIALLALLVAGGAFFGGGIAEQSVQLMGRLPQVIEGAKERLRESPLGARAMELIQSHPGEAGSGGQSMFLRTGLGLIGATFGALAHVAIVLFFALFLAAQPRLYVQGLVQLVPPARRARAGEVLHAIGQTLRRWLVGQSLLALGIALVTGIGLWALGVPFALPLALFAGLMEFVPYIGPLLAAIPAVLVAFSDSPQLAAWVALLYVGVQILESYVLAPLVQHRAVDLPPALILFAQVLLGVFAGGLGVAVATPLAAAVVVVVRMLYVEDTLLKRDQFPPPT